MSQIIVTLFHEFAHAYDWNFKYDNLESETKALVGDNLHPTTFLLVEQFRRIRNEGIAKLSDRLNTGMNLNNYVLLNSYNYFSELVEFDICKECSEEMPISISYA